MPLSRHSEGTYQETSSRATRQETLGHSRLSSRPLWIKSGGKCGSCARELISTERGRGGGGSTGTKSHHRNHLFFFYLLCRVTHTCPLSDGLSSPLLPQQPSHAIHSHVHNTWFFSHGQHNIHPVARRGSSNEFPAMLLVFACCNLCVRQSKRL